MRAFVVLSFIAVVSAGRLGYDYQLGGSGYQSPSGSIGSIIGGLPDFGLNSNQGSAAPIYGGRTSSGNINFGNDLGRSAVSGSSGLHAPIVDEGPDTEFYIYSAPEEEFNDADASQRAVASLKKNLRVVFIKAPENNGLANAALQLAKQASQDRTAIYVLSKQPDISELANQVQSLRNSVKQKPEVRFIKYRTAEDVINAQRSIQQQYDSLGGSSKSSNEGVAPVINFASAPQYSGRSIGGNLGESVLSSNISPNRLIGGGAIREYLPPIVY